ncbi:MAG: dTDP-4-dehydrorhamnose 3,5-epimerase [Deltaproteobacteria bacterium]|nr:dTDP-4-dehydrorhamnose 3,5-epimerase [Deltaproteobacteria bacterium]
MEFISAEIAGVSLIKPDIFRDQRGFFMETFHRGKYADAGIGYDFVQDNMSRSARGTVRGLHYQLQQPQGKLVFVLQGEIFDVAVDIRRGSPSFGRWLGFHLSADNRQQLFLPPGLAHGFMVLSESAEVYYKCTDLYLPGDEYGLLWNDPEIGIEWPRHDGVILSEKDLSLPAMAAVKPENLPPWLG